jgi:hypothetical protein
VRWVRLLYKHAYIVTMNRRPNSPTTPSYPGDTSTGSTALTYDGIPNKHPKHPWYTTQAPQYPAPSSRSDYSTLVILRFQVGIVICEQLLRSLIDSKLRLSNRLERIFAVNALYGSCAHLKLRPSLYPMGPVKLVITFFGGRCLVH